MDLGLRGKVALVAAASKGLGKAAAWELAREGCAVALAARGEEALRAAAREIGADTGAEVLPVRADVARPEEIDALVATVERALGPPAILVNNAGGPPPGTFADVTDEDWARAHELTLMSAVRLSRRVLPAMRAARWGRIINITSLSVKQPMPNLILSNALRVAVVAMAKTLGGQVAGEGITVNNVCPGYMLTDRLRQLAADSAAREGISVDAVLARYAKTTPAGRVGQPEELAALIAFLASERAGYITGSTIAVEGGAYAGLQ